ncbi:MAG: MFS transporter [Dehalococcoidia bacterium]|nr:MFS transporter [Dehalococcoidia bacterium]
MVVPNSAHFPFGRHPDCLPPLNGMPYQTCLPVRRRYRAWTWNRAPGRRLLHWPRGYPDPRDIAIRKPFFGWYLVLVILQGLFLGAGLSSFALGVLLPRMSTDLGWSLATLVGANSIGSVASSLASPPLGGLIDRRGARGLLTVTTLLTGLSVALCGLVREPWQFYLLFGIVPGICRGGMMNVAPSAMIAQWFHKKRSLAFSIVAVGPPLAGLIFPPVTAALLAWFDWRGSWFAWGGFTMLLALGPLLLVRRRPEDMGLLPDGESAPPPDSGPAGGAAGSPVPDDDWTFREAVGSAGFWVVAASMALVMVMPAALLLFLFSFYRDLGFSEPAAAGLLSAAYSIQLVARLGIWGPLAVRLGSVRWVAPLWGALMLASTLFFMLVNGELLAFASIVLFGVAMGGSMVVHLQVWPEYFGRRSVGSITGLGSLLWGVSSAAGPLIGALVLDHTGNYNLLFAIVSALVFVGVALLLVTGRPVRPRRTPALA